MIYSSEPNLSKFKQIIRGQAAGVICVKCLVCLLMFVFAMPQQNHGAEKNECDEIIFNVCIVVWMLATVVFAGGLIRLAINQR